MNSNQYIGQTLQVVIDRPLGSRHPQYGFLYPINYGYLPGVLPMTGRIWMPTFLMFPNR